MANASRTWKGDALRYGIVILCLWAIGWGVLCSGIAHYPWLLAMGGLSLVFGLEHAFDCDHIAFIDNTTRKLVQMGKRTRGAGFFFSLGHSTVVFCMGILTITAVELAKNAIPKLAAWGNVAGTIISAVFLFILCLANIVILRRTYHTFKEVKAGRYNPADDDVKRKGESGVDKAVNKVLNVANKNWQIYVIGFLFGLGFDTATQVAMLATSAQATAAGAPPTAVIALPILFAAGMCLMDTLDGFFMASAYKWTLTSPLKKIYYNMIITILSVTVAFIVAWIEVIQVIGMEANSQSGFLFWIQNINFADIGYCLVGMFALAWLLSWFFWKILHLSEKDIFLKEQLEKNEAIRAMVVEANRVITGAGEATFDPEELKKKKLI